MGAVAGIVHFVDVVAKVAQVFGVRLLRGGRGPAQIELFQSAQDGRPSFMPQLMAAGLDPRGATGLVAREYLLAQFDQVLAGMPEVENHFRPRKALAEFFLGPAPRRLRRSAVGRCRNRRRWLASQEQAHLL